VAAPPPPPPAPALAVKKVSFAGITTKKAKPAAADKYPTFLADDQVKAAVDWLIANNPIPDQLKQVKADLAVQVTPFYFEQASGKVEAPSSVLVPGTTGLVTVTFPSRYDSATEEVLQPILSGRLGQFFRQAFKLEIDGDKIPADQAQELVAELSALFGKHGCADALAVKDQLVPVADFHAKRHLDLTVEQNLALNAVCRIQTRVSPRK
jgi:hypothetical protein